MKGKTRPWRFLWIALLGLAVGGWWFAGRAAGEGAGGWVELRRDDLVLGVEVTGTLAAVDSAYVRPPQIPDMWNQKIAYLAPEGAEVRTGTPVLKLDDSELQKKLVEKLGEASSAQQELEKKQANLAQARGDDELHLAEAEGRRRTSALKADVPPDLVASHDLVEARSELALAEREIAYVKERLRLSAKSGAAEVAELADKRDRAAARVAEIRRQIEQMTVRAPRAGTVVYVADRGGEKKKVGDAVWEGQQVIEIPSLARMRADAFVDEADAGRVAVGQVVRLRLDAHPDTVFTGRVASIRSAVEQRTEAERQKVVGLTLELDRTDPLRMRPGMRFQGTAETGRADHLLLMPAEAVLATATGPLVYRKTLLGVEAVRPRLGRRNGQAVEVLSGLAPGDRVARAPARLYEERAGA
ncbi:MAG TPA: efflux RND transporter periplasmic adaptor subunit [Thermoanaerobaculia bacterium]|nr:efflux RND transporter periplasmic adaptor subunit [Thermoanaerobaculia bacterium]